MPVANSERVAAYAHFATRPKAHRGGHKTARANESWNGNEVDLHSSPGDDSHKTGLQLHINFVDAFQASEAVSDGLGSRHSLKALHGDRDPFEPGVSREGRIRLHGRERRASGHAPQTQHSDGKNPCRHRCSFSKQVLQCERGSPAAVPQRVIDVLVDRNLDIELKEQIRSRIDLKTGGN